LNWLITGGCGFIGTALIRRLLEDGGQVIRVVDNLTTGTRDDLRQVSNFREISRYSVFGDAQHVELIVGNILEDDLAVVASRGCDIIIHLAANTGVGPSVENPRADLLANVLGTFNYLEAARINKVPRFVFASSSAPVGEVEPPIHEELAPHPVSPYGASKLAGEGYCSAYSRTFGVETVMLRFGNVYGPGSVHKHSVVAQFIRRAMAGDILEIYGEGNQTRDFIYIDDLIDAIVLAAMTPDIGGEVFQIASNSETSVREIAERLEGILKESGIVGVRTSSGGARAGDVMRNYSDTTKARTVLGWRPKVCLDDGLHKTVSYFQNQKSGQA